MVMNSWKAGTSVDHGEETITHEGPFPTLRRRTFREGLITHRSQHYWAASGILGPNVAINVLRRAPTSTTGKEAFDLQVALHSPISPHVQPRSNGPIIASVRRSWISQSASWGS